MINLDIKDLVMLNQYAQKVITKDKINSWFSILDEENQRNLLKQVWVLAWQAQVREEDIPKAILSAGLKPTHTPAVILLSGSDKLIQKGNKLLKTKGTVLKQAFDLVLECFVIADNRRRKKCGAQCHHWWHEDLSKIDIIEKILRNTQ